MKKLFAILILCLSCCGILEAQDTNWKPFEVPFHYTPDNQIPILAAVAPNGNLLAYGGFEGLFLSQDEGETWEIVLNSNHFNYKAGVTIGREGRIFAAMSFCDTIYYSDDSGNTWQEFSENPAGGDQYSALYSPSNEILFYWDGDPLEHDSFLFYTLDSGDTWDIAYMSFITSETSISDVIANEAGDVYVSVCSDHIQPESTTLGVYHSTLSDMQQWELVAFEGIGIKDMEFDPEGNVLCAVDSEDGFSGFEHVPGFYAFQAPNVCVSDNGIIYKLVNNGNALAYSFDHGEHFYNTILDFPFLGIYHPEDYGLIKGHDNHLYCYIYYYEYWKSIRSADDILGAFSWSSEWYYELLNDDGSITYQHLECTGDTTINNERPKVIVRSNTQYDRDTIFEVTHEYIYEDNGFVYWWNKELEEFTILYDFTANAGDEWEIKVGTESLTMHVDAVELYEYEGNIYRMLSVSDPEDLFSGDIVCGIGHLTSFFPERLMNRDKDFRVDGLRCYWEKGELIFKIGDADCDAIYSELQGLEEDGPSTSSGTAETLMVYPNPTNNVLFVETQCFASQPTTTAYRITNLMGQTILTGNITPETQQINIESLPADMYFISVGEQTVKFVVK